MLQETEAESKLERKRHLLLDAQCATGKARFTHRQSGRGGIKFFGAPKP
jgi:hypothetical protein